MSHLPAHERDRLQRLRDADLNDLLVLSLLLATQGVSKTADKLELSQPAVSRTLERLREMFDDPLLVRSGNAMVLTPRGRNLLPLVEEFLRSATRVLAGDAPEGPASFRREVRIGCSEYVQISVAPLLPRIRAEAPGLRINFLPMLGTEHAHAGLAAGTVDLMVGMMTETLALLRIEHLYSERFICLMRRPSAGATVPELSFQDFCERPHLDVSPTGRQVLGARIDSTAHRLGGRRNVVSTISSFVAAPLVVRETDLICLIPERIAARLQLPADIAVVPLGFPPPTLDIVMYWHNVTDQDVVCSWLRKRFAEELARPLPAM